MQPGIWITIGLGQIRRSIAVLARGRVLDLSRFLDLPEDRRPKTEDGPHTNVAGNRVQSGIHHARVLCGNAKKPSLVDPCSSPGGAGSLRCQPGGRGAHVQGVWDIHDAAYGVTQATHALFCCIAADVSPRGGDEASSTRGRGETRKTPRVHTIFFPPSFFFPGTPAACTRPPLYSPLVFVSPATCHRSSFSSHTFHHTSATWRPPRRQMAPPSWWRIPTTILTI